MKGIGSIGMKMRAPKMGLQKVHIDAVNREYNALHSIRSPKARKSKLPAVHVPKGINPLKKRY